MEGCICVCVAKELQDGGVDLPMANTFRNDFFMLSLAALSEKNFFPLYADSKRYLDDSTGRLGILVE